VAYKKQKKEKKEKELPQPSVESGPVGQSPKAETHKKNLEIVQGNASIVNCDIDLREFDDTNLQLQQKILIWEWQKSLINRPGATLMMINSLEMTIKFSQISLRRNG